MRLAVCSTLTLLSAALLSSIGWTQSVHVVDADRGIGTDFTLVGAAVAAAAEGDIVLVRAGDYEEALLLGDKSLTIVAEQGDAVELFSISISELAAGKVLVLRGIDNSASDQFGMQIENNAGTIWIEDMLVSNPFHPAGTAGGITVDASLDLVLARVEVLPPIIPDGVKDALRSTDSRVHLFDCMLRAGVVGNGVAGNPGQIGMRVVGGFAFLSGGSVRGGDGADGQSLFDPDGHDGGSGLVASGSDPEVIVLDAALIGGAGGSGIASGSDGVDGAPTDIQGGSLTLQTATARSLVVTSPVRDDATATMTYSGLAGDEVWLVQSGAPAAGMTSPAFDGELLLAAPLTCSFRGTLDATGTLVDVIPMSDLGLGVEGATFYLQARFINPATSEVVLSGPATLQIIDAGSCTQGPGPRACPAADPARSVQRTL